jgi:uncharacterized PurR-regulated membrane protein YhhQ (DUF165 family)
MRRKDNRMLATNAVDSRTRTFGLLSLIAYIGTIFAANWAIERFGVVPVGFGLMAPAGVYFVGLAFTFRDLTQRTLGRRWTVLAILHGAGLSFFVSPDFAVASGVAFLFSEFADFAVYTPLAERRWVPAVALSNVVGTVVDSVLFLWLAFRSLEFLSGQIIGKLWMTAAAIVAISLWRATRRRRDLFVTAA